MIVSFKRSFRSTQRTQRTHASNAKNTPRQCNECKKNTQQTPNAADATAKTQEQKRAAKRDALRPFRCVCCMRCVCWKPRLILISVQSRRATGCQATNSVLCFVQLHKFTRR